MNLIQEYRDGQKKDIENDKALEITNPVYVRIRTLLDYVLLFFLMLFSYVVGADMG